MQKVLGRFHIQSVSPPPSYEGSTSEEKEQISQDSREEQDLTNTKEASTSIVSQKRGKTRLSISLAHNQQKPWIKTFLIQVTNI